MPRASWRGHLRLSLVSCRIYLSPATARTKPIRLHQVWRATPAEDNHAAPARSAPRPPRQPTAAMACRRRHTPQAAG